MSQEQPERRTIRRFCLFHFFASHFFAKSAAQPHRANSRFFAFRPQFTLRMLLVVTAVLAIWLNTELNRARRQQAAVQAIQAYGGMVRYDFEPEDPKLRKPPPEPRWLVDLVGIDFLHNVEDVNLMWQTNATGPVDNQREDTEILQRLGDLPGLKSLLLGGLQATDESMRTVAELDSLESVTILTHRWFDKVDRGKTRQSPHRVTAAGIAHLAALPRLRSFGIDGGKLDDHSLRTLGQFRKLEELWLHGQWHTFSDAGLAYLAGLKRLRALHFEQAFLASIHFSDQGIASILELQNLEELALRGSISDQGLAQLATLPKLQQLFVASNSITPAGAGQFQQSLPGVTFRSSRCASVSELIQRDLARMFRMDRATITVNSSLSGLGFNREMRRKLIDEMRAGYFRLERDDAPNLQDFVTEFNAAGDLTVQQLAELVQKHAGK
jgi:hypothetical protein